MIAIQSLMETELTNAEVGETVARVANRMSDNRVGAVLVLEGGQLRGIFSERDLLQRVVVAGRDPHTTNVEDVMTADVATAELSASVKEVLEIFREKGVRHLPITHESQTVGILSTRDLLAYIVRSLERFINEAEYSKAIADGVDPYDHMGGSYGR